MHFYAWKAGLKTGMYYLRSKAAVDPIKFTLDKQHQRVQASATAGVVDLAEDQEPAIEKTPEQVFLEGEVCTMEDGCLSCGS